MSYDIDFENITKEKLIGITERLLREIDYYKKVLDRNNIKY